MGSGCAGCVWCFKDTGGEAPAEASSRSSTHPETRPSLLSFFFLILKLCRLRVLHGQCQDARSMHATWGPLLNCHSGTTWMAQQAQVFCCFPFFLGVARIKGARRAGTVEEGAQGVKDRCSSSIINPTNYLPGTEYSRGE